MRGDNILPWSEYAQTEWKRMEDTWTSADPLTVPEDPLPAATRNRDGLLLALAVLVIVGLAGYAIGRAS